MTTSISSKKHLQNMAEKLCRCTHCEFNILLLPVWANWLHLGAVEWLRSWSCQYMYMFSPENADLAMVNPHSWASHNSHENKSLTRLSITGPQRGISTRINFKFVEKSQKLQNWTIPPCKHWICAVTFFSYSPFLDKLSLYGVNAKSRNCLNHDIEWAMPENGGFQKIEIQFFSTENNSMSTSFGKKLVTLLVTTKMSKLIAQCVSLTEENWISLFFHVPIFGYCPLSASMTFSLSLSVKKAEVEALCYVFKTFSPTPKMDRTRFRDILHNSFNMTEDIIMDRGNMSFCGHPKPDDQLLCKKKLSLCAKFGSCPSTLKPVFFSLAQFSRLSTETTTVTSAWMSGSGDCPSSSGATSPRRRSSASKCLTPTETVSFRETKCSCSWKLVSFAWVSTVAKFANELPIKWACLWIVENVFTRVELNSYFLIIRLTWMGQNTQKNRHGMDMSIKHPKTMETPSTQNLLSFPHSF